VTTPASDEAAQRAGDVRRILWAQGTRAFAYGLAALLLGTTLDRLGLSGVEAGGVLAAVVAGTALASVAVARFGDSVGRRHMYLVFSLLLGASGLIFAYAATWWLLVLAALSGTISTEVVGSGPFVSLEQAMLAAEPEGRRRLQGFGLYNAVAAGAGSLGALALGAPGLLRRFIPGLPVDQRFFLVLVVAAAAGALCASRLSPAVEAPGRGRIAPDRRSRRRGGLRGSRAVVARLASLFALDSLAGGFVVQAFLAYWFTSQFHASPGELGVLFFAVGVVQTASFLVAPRLGNRFGLLRTMVGTHLPSNLLLAAVPLASTFAGAAGLLVVRSALSQMDVPLRQAYLVALVEPSERTAAVGYTNAVRYLTRPIGPAVAGASMAVLPGLPFFVAGALKIIYDLSLWAWFRHVPLVESEKVSGSAGDRRRPAVGLAVGRSSQGATPSTARPGDQSHAASPPPVIPIPSANVTPTPGKAADDSKRR